MNPAIYICCFLPLIIVLLQQAAERKNLAVRRAAKKRKGKGKIMTDMLNAYIGKDCLVYTMGSQVAGVIREISDGWILVDKGRETEAVNLDYVIRVREYPKNKKGKRAAIVTD